MIEWRALSLTQPWAWIILNLHKRIENRPRNIGNYRGPLLLHAAKRMTPDDYWRACEFVKRHFGTDAAESIPDSRYLDRGAIVGRCRVVNQCGPNGKWVDSGPPEITPDAEQAPWYMFAHAYFLAGVEPTKPIACAGALGFWRPPFALVARAEAGVS